MTEISKLSDRQLAEFKELLLIVQQWKKQHGYHLFFSQPFYDQHGNDALFEIVNAMKDAVRLGLLESRDQAMSSATIKHPNGQFSFETYNQLRVTPEGRNLIERDFSAVVPEAVVAVFMWMPSKDDVEKAIFERQERFLSVVKDIVKVQTGGKWKAERVDDDFRQDKYLPDKIERKASESSVIIADLAGGRPAVQTEIGIVRGQIVSGKTKHLFVTVPNGDDSAKRAVEENVYIKNIPYQRYDDPEDLRKLIGPAIRECFQSTTRKIIHSGATYPFLSDQVAASATAATVGTGESAYSVSYHKGPNCD